MTEAPIRNTVRPERGRAGQSRIERLPDALSRPVLSAEEAFAELGIDRSTGYKAIREGTFPLPVIRVGRVIRIPTLALRRLLLLDADPPASG